MASAQGSSNQSEIAQAALAVVEHLSAQGNIEIPESVVGSSERKIARTAHQKLSPGSVDSETAFQTCSLLVLQVPPNYFVPAPLYASESAAASASASGRNKLVVADA